MRKPKLVPYWRSLWRSWAVQIAAVGAVLPEVLQLIADNTAMLSWLNDGYKSGIRLACLVAIPIARSVQQQSLAGKK